MVRENFKVLYMLLITRDMTGVKVVDIGLVSEDSNTVVVGSICLNSQRGPSHTHVRYGTHIVDGDRHRDERMVEGLVHCWVQGRSDRWGERGQETNKQ